MRAAPPSPALKPYRSCCSDRRCVRRAGRVHTGGRRVPGVRRWRAWLPPAAVFPGGRCSRTKTWRRGGRGSCRVPGRSLLAWKSRTGCRCPCPAPRDERVQTRAVALVVEELLELVEDQEQAVAAEQQLVEDEVLDAGSGSMSSASGARPSRDWKMPCLRSCTGSPNQMR